VTCTVRRIGKGLRGRLVVTLVGLFTRAILQRDFERMLSQLSSSPE
jgi:hypothetical protein